MGDDPAERIEATTEYPVMYHALGTEPRTEHPFNVYHDIRSEPIAVKRTLEVVGDSVESVAGELIRRDIRHIVGIGMGTSQFVPQAAGPAYWEWSHITSEDRDSVELLTVDKPYDVEHTALFAYSGSGSTVDTIAATEKMKEKRCGDLSSWISGLLRPFSRQSELDLLSEAFFQPHVTSQAMAGQLATRMVSELPG